MRFPQPGISRDLTAIFALVAVLVTLFVIRVDAEFTEQAKLASMVDSTGRLRMLSQKLNLATLRTIQGSASSGESLPALQNQFEAGVQSVEAWGFAEGKLLGLPSEFADSVIKLRAQWGKTRSLSQQAIAGNHLFTSKEISLVQVIEGNDALLDSADGVVRLVLTGFVEKRERFRRLLPVAIVLGLLLVACVYIYIRRQVFRPMADIMQMSDHLAKGEFASRIQGSYRGEFGALIERLNHNADLTGQLLSEKETTERMIRDSELRNRTLWEVCSDAIIIIDGNGTICFANPAVFTIFGHTPESLTGQNIDVLQPLHLREFHRIGFERYKQQGVRRINWKGTEITGLHCDGHEIPVELSFAHMVLSDTEWFVGFFRDITLRAATQSQLHLLNRAIESTSEGVMITDAQGNDHPIVYVNSALQKMTGYTSADLLGRNGRIFLGVERDQMAVQSLAHLLRHGNEGTVVLQCGRKDGSPFWNEVAVAPVRDSDHTVVHYISIFKDITERKIQEQALVHSANFDLLTGLPNRSLLSDRIGQAIASAKRRQTSAGLLFIDLDNFKVVNDSLGHAIGDQLLTAVALRLSSCLRDGDTAARLGGDEFVLLLAELDSPRDCALVAERVKQSLAEVFHLSQHDVFVSASIGGSLFPQDGLTGEQLLQQADMAMYRAKEHGRNTFQLYTHEMQTHINHRLTVETQLRHALDRNEFVLHYQPQIELATGRMIGAEALVRWQHPTLGFVSPAHFIPIAEETGLIVPIGEWVMEAACREAKRWTQCIPGIKSRPIAVAVNLSARQFSQSNLIEVVTNILKRTSLDVSELELEITESLVMQDPEKTSVALRHLRELGLKIALDDFGTGYSSLAYLRKFPVDRLKIDRSFVQDVAIVSAVIQLARSFGLQTVAEGVEDLETSACLKHMGCDIIQGYVYSKPLPADELIRYAINNFQPNSVKN